MQETLDLVFDEISFEMGVGGEKYELILTPEGDKVKLFELVYFQIGRASCRERVFVPV